MLSVKKKSPPRRVLFTHCRRPHPLGLGKASKPCGKTNDGRAMDCLRCGVPGLPGGVQGAPGATEVQGEGGEKTKEYKKKRPRSSPWTGRLRCRFFYCTCPGGKRQAESNIFHIFRSGPAGRALDRICFFMHDYTNDTPRRPFRARRSRGVARRHILKEVFPHANPPRHPG